MPTPMLKTHDKLFAAGNRISTIVGNKSSGERTMEVESGGASGDIYENKGTGKSTRAECQERSWVPEVRRLRLGGGTILTSGS